MLVSRLRGAADKGSLLSRFERNSYFSAGFPLKTEDQLCCYRAPSQAADSRVEAIEGLWRNSQPVASDRFMVE
jgi:hypothetical protein